MKKKFTASSKDKKDWETFINQIDEVESKEVDFPNNNEIYTLKKLDLHGYSLNDANHEVKKFLIKSFEKGYRKILIVTGKGSRSKVSTNPYISEKFGVLKNSIPEFIRNDENLIILLQTILLLCLLQCFQLHLCFLVHHNIFFLDNLLNICLLI